MRYKAYINSAGKLAIAEYRKGYKPENETYPTREEALAALAHLSTAKQMTVRQFAAAGFEVTGVDYKDSIETLAATVMQQRGWKFAGYDGNGDELFETTEGELQCCS